MENKKTAPDGLSLRGTKRWLTPTAINTFINCPRKFFNRYISKIRQAPNIYLIRGAAVHRAIEQFYRLKLNQCRAYEAPELKQLLHDIFRCEWEARGKILNRLGLTASDQSYFLNDSLRMLDNFIDGFFDNQRFEDPDTEKQISSEKFKLKGRIDAIYKNSPNTPPLIIDFKTNKSMEFNPVHKRQLGLYALLYFEKYQVMPDVGIHFLRFKNGLKQMAVTPEYLESMKDMITDIHIRTQSDDIADYPCVCGMCDKSYKKAA
jgi:CRISPR/Cas system-associated exonuclease Cas4 (RecB family)